MALLPAGSRLALAQRMMLRVVGRLACSSLMAPIKPAAAKPAEGQEDAAAPPSSAAAAVAPTGSEVKKKGKKGVHSTRRTFQHFKRASSSMLSHGGVLIYDQYQGVCAAPCHVHSPSDHAFSLADGPTSFHYTENAESIEYDQAGPQGGGRTYAWGPNVESRAPPTSSIAEGTYLTRLKSTGKSAMAFSRNLVLMTPTAPSLPSLLFCFFLPVADDVLGTHMEQESGASSPGERKEESGDLELGGAVSGAVERTASGNVSSAVCVCCRSLSAPPCGALC